MPVFKDTFGPDGRCELLFGKEADAEVEKIIGADGKPLLTERSPGEEAALEEAERQRLLRLQMEDELLQDAERLREQISNRAKLED
ncbi:hypothetical protein ACFLZH_02140 [Patescibacteria group bacterium]